MLKIILLPRLHPIPTVVADPRHLDHCKPPPTPQTQTRTPYTQHATFGSRQASALTHPPSTPHPAGSPTQPRRSKAFTSLPPRHPLHSGHRSIERLFASRFDQKTFSSAASRVSIECVPRSPTAFLRCVCGVCRRLGHNLCLHPRRGKLESGRQAPLRGLAPP